MPKIKINDISMYYEIHGAGEPLVLIAGFGSDHTVWDWVVEQFKEQYKVILFDNRGAGQTDVAEGPYTLEQMMGDIVALCSELDIDKAHFIGNSLGGFILQALAFHHPDLVKSAIINNSALQIAGPFQIYLQAQLAFLKAEVPLIPLIKASCCWAFSYHFLSQPGMLDMLVKRTLENPYPFTIQGYEGQYAVVEQFDARTWAGKIKVPTLVLASDQDLICREQLAKQPEEYIPGATYHCFSECGHLPQIEYPDEFARVVLKFLLSCSRITGSDSHEKSLT